MSETITAALIGVVGAIVAGVLGALLGAKISRDASRELLTQQAKAEFKAAFTNTLVELYSDITRQDDRLAFDILNAGYPLHLAAYIKLRSVLTREDQRAIDRAWKQYTEYAGDDPAELSEERARYRFCDVLEPQSTEQQNLLAIKRINALLEAVTLPASIGTRPKGGPPINSLRHTR